MPNTYTNEEYADMYFIYGFCTGNIGLLLRNAGRFIDIAGLRTAEHLKQYPEVYGRPVPPREQMQRLDKSGLQKAMSWQQRNESISRLSRTTGVAQPRVWTVVHRACLYPSHVQGVQRLVPRITPTD